MEIREGVLFLSLRDCSDIENRLSFYLKYKYKDYGKAATLALIDIAGKNNTSIKRVSSIQVEDTTVTHDKYVKLVSVISTNLQEIRQSIEDVTELIDKFVTEVKSPVPGAKAYLFKKCIVFVDDDKKHLSVSAGPTSACSPAYEDVRYVRNRFLPLDKVYTMTEKRKIVHLFEVEPTRLYKFLSRLGIVQLL